MVVSSNQNSTQQGQTPRGYKVAGLSAQKLRTTAETALPFLRAEGCFQRGEFFLDASHLLENVLHRAGYNYHIVDRDALTDTAAFTIPEEHLLVVRQDIYDGLDEDVELTRFRRHLSFGTGGACYEKAPQPVCAGIPRANGRVSQSRPIARRACARVRADGANDLQLGGTSRSRQRQAA